MKKISNGKWTNECYEYVSLYGRSDLSKELTYGVHDDVISIYFNEVKREYIMNNTPTEYEFIPENRDIFIKNNLKLVISCAKRYRNLGVEFSDLIQSGNEGLLCAYEKFDNSRQTLKSAIIKSIEESSLSKFDYSDSLKIINSNLG